MHNSSLLDQLREQGSINVLLPGTVSENVIDQFLDLNFPGEVFDGKTVCYVSPDKSEVGYAEFTFSKPIAPEQPLEIVVSYQQEDVIDFLSSTIESLNSEERKKLYQITIDPIDYWSTELEKECVIFSWIAPHEENNFYYLSITQVPEGFELRKTNLGEMENIEELQEMHESDIRSWFSSQSFDNETIIDWLNSDHFGDSTLIKTFPKLTPVATSFISNYCDVVIGSVFITSARLGREEFAVYPKSLRTYLPTKNCSYATSVKELKRRIDALISSATKKLKQDV